MTFEEFVKEKFDVEKEDKKMEYFITIGQGANKLEFTADSHTAVNEIIEYVNAINFKTDAKLSFRMDLLNKED